MKPQPLSPLLLRNLRKRQLVHSLASRGVAYVSFDPRAAEVSMPPGAGRTPMCTVRLSHGFTGELTLSDWGFEQRLSFRTASEWPCRVPWGAVFLVAPSSMAPTAESVSFPDDSPPDGPMGAGREVV